MNDEKNLFQQAWKRFENGSLLPQALVILGYYKGLIFTRGYFTWWLKTVYLIFNLAGPMKNSKILFKPDLHTPILSADSKYLKFPSKTQAKIGPKSVTSSQIFQNRRSHCIEAIFCLRLLGAFQKSADKFGVCKSGFRKQWSVISIKFYLWPGTWNFNLAYKNIKWKRNTWGTIRMSPGKSKMETLFWFSSEKDS